MGNGADDTTVTAERRMRLIRNEFTTRARSTDPGPRTRAPHSPSPIDLDILDHVTRSVAEIVTHTRAVAPDAGPAPADAAKVYAWMRDHTAHLDETRQRVRDTLVFRQSLEHAVRMGDEKAIRRERCPGCECWGLFWRAAAKRAVCVNRYCVDDMGRPSVWTLAQLAQHHMAQIPRRAAT